MTEIEVSDVILKLRKMMEKKKGKVIENPV